MVDHVSQFFFNVINWFGQQYYYDVDEIERRWNQYFQNS